MVYSRRSQFSYRSHNASTQEILMKKVYAALSLGLLLSANSVAIAAPAPTDNPSASLRTHLIALDGVLDQSDNLEWDQTYYDAYSFNGIQGQSLTIDMAGNNFLPYLYVVSPNGQYLGQASADGNNQATITVTLPSNGLYEIRANAYHAGEGGNYSLTAIVNGQPVTLGSTDQTAAAVAPTPPNNSPVTSNTTPSSGTTVANRQAICTGNVTLSQIQIDGLLEAHNQTRAAENANLPNLQWNCDLAAVAQAWADRGEFNHSSSGWRNANYQNISGQSVRWIGENLYWSSAPNGNPVNAVTSWASERTDYNYANNSCTGVCGHYTQIVWRDTTDVGCGVYNRGETIVVCQYLPGGNFNGEKPF